MDASPRATLRKRTRRTDPVDYGPFLTRRQPKRPRVSCKQQDASSSPSSSARPRSGLLTPEHSGLVESQHGAAVRDVEPHEMFPFMNLPAELRIHIYHMALDRLEPLFLHVPRVPDVPEHDFPPPPITRYSDLSSMSTVAVNRIDTRRHDVPLPADEHPTPLSDPIVPQILLLNKTIYKEARQVLYSENVFRLRLSSGIHTLSSLHQRSRSLIKHVILTIPSHHDILDGFADLVRLGLRYCWGLKTFKIILKASLPDDGRISGGATSVYANAFHILRWLPRGCKVVLEGRVTESVKRVVEEEGRLQSVLDEEDYLKRQHQMVERH